MNETNIFITSTPIETLLWQYILIRDILDTFDDGVFYHFGIYQPAILLAHYIHYPQRETSE